MAKNEDLEIELEDLKKQFWYLMKTTIPEMQNLSSQMATLQEELLPQITDLSSQVSNLSSQVTGLNSQATTLSNQVSGFSEQISTLGTEISNTQNGLYEVNTQISDLSSQVSTFKEETASQVEDLSSSVTNLVDVTIPELEAKIGEGGGSGGGEKEWVTLYDKDSTDEALNYGYPDGLVGGLGTISNSADFSPYNYLRITYWSENHEFVVYQDVRRKSPIEFFSFTMIDEAFTGFTGVSYSIITDDSGAKRFFVGNVRQILFVIIGKATTGGMKNGNTSFYFGKIEGAI
ncbi:MAG: hypothetical protein J6K39_02195 [Clostridia bacterium]|nr:hypothetical protein [Clostridia bacterium]